MSNIVAIDQELCTGCQRCSEICPAGAITGTKDEPQQIDDDKCVICGQCVQICSAYQEYQKDLKPRKMKMQERGMLDSVKEPLFAAHYVGNAQKVWDALQDPNVYTIVQCAPAVRVSLAEDFGMDSGELVVGKMFAALRQLGFDNVYDTNFAADLTIMEEGSELIERLNKQENLPMFTSCCPARVRHMEQEYPEFVRHLSSCKSPQQMAGALYKTYGAKVNGIEAQSILSVAIMPCTAKKFEAARPEMKASGYQDVDIVLTTRELAQLIKHAGIDFQNLEPGTADTLLGEYSGAGNIFGVTGGVMEAAIRTGYELVTGISLSEFEVKDVRYSEGIKRSTIKMGELELNIAVVAGLQNVKKIMQEVREGISNLHFIEVMACPMGCISGGGQPKILIETERLKIYAKRRESMYTHDRELPVRLAPFMLA